MRFSSTALALAAVPAVVLGATQTVTVGENNLLAFNPSTITAAVGDMINFEFHSKNHTATQSTFASPCAPASFNGSSGVDSGFLFISPNQTFTNGTFPTWSITINATTPLWFHCKQKTPISHCGAGMVLSINPSADKTAAAFTAAAMAQGNATAPAASASPPSGTAAAADAAAPAGSAAASQESPSTTPNPNGASKVAYTRGAAGLLTVVAVGAALL